MQKVNALLICAVFLLASCTSDDEMTLNSVDEDSLKRERAALAPLSPADVNYR
jgi:hypothetical protein